MKPTPVRKQWADGQGCQERTRRTEGRDSSHNGYVFDLLLDLIPNGTKIDGLIKRQDWPSIVQARRP